MIVKKPIKTPKIIGWKEWFSLDSLGLPAIKAKIDTGAKTSALHAMNIKNYFIDGAEYVKFDIHPLQKNKNLIRRCNAKVIEHRMVSDSSGKKERRMVIKSDLKIGKFRQRIELTLTNRDSMNFRMLLGREAIKKGGMVVDVSRSFVQGKKKKRNILQLYNEI